MSPDSPIGEVCPGCGGENGFHFMTCRSRDGADQVIGSDADHGAESPTPSPCCGVAPGEAHTDACCEGRGVRLGTPYHGPAAAGAMAERVAKAHAEEMERVAKATLIRLTAKTCHEVNRAFCAEICDDHSHVPWDSLDSETRESAIGGVRYAMESPEATSEDMHQSWMTFKTAHGWRYGEVKDALEKTHPNLVPYADLSANERAKDALFLAVCRSMLG